MNALESFMTSTGKGVPFDSEGIQALDVIIQDLLKIVDQLDTVKKLPEQYTYQEVELILNGLIGFDIRSRIYLTAKAAQQSDFLIASYRIESD